MRKPERIEEALAIYREVLGNKYDFIQGILTPEEFQIYKDNTWHQDTLDRRQRREAAAQHLINLKLTDDYVSTSMLDSVANSMTEEQLILAFVQFCKKSVGKRPVRQKGYLRKKNHN